MAVLIVTHQGNRLDELNLPEGTVTVGRAPDNDIVLKDTAVSGHHAKIITFFEPTFIQDLGSTNGTYVNDKRILKHTLTDGDVITIGEHQILFDATRETDDSLHEESTRVLSFEDIESLLQQSDSKAAKTPGDLNKSNMPKEINWVAQDADGLIWGFECKPIETEEGWNEFGVGICIKLGQGKPNPDWRSSLRKV